MEQKDKNLKIMLNKLTLFPEAVPMVSHQTETSATQRQVVVRRTEFPLSFSDDDATVLYRGFMFVVLEARV